MSDVAATQVGATLVATLAEELAGALVGADVSDPRREARWILADVLDVPLWWPAVHGDRTVDGARADAARQAAERRARGAPLAYAVGRVAFRHLTLDVDERVLIPRPETEMLVDIMLEATGTAPGGTVIDVGTGSGAIALALASEGPFERVIGTDVSADAIAVARRNAARLPAAVAARVEFRHGSWLGPVRDVRARAIVSNPPYISYAEAELLPASVREWEPRVALLTGADGVAATAEVIRQSAELLVPDGVLALEVDARRAAQTMQLVDADGRYTDVITRQDLTGRDRFVVGRRGRTDA